MIEKPLRKSRSDGEQSRERLLLAAMKLFAEQGFARTSTREIALAAGANVAAISYYFGDKAGLYKAALTDFLPPPQKNIEMFDQPHFTLREALEGYYAQLLGPLLEGEEAELCMRLWLREVLEPRGVWAEELNNGIRAEHMAFAGVLARHLGVPVDDEVHRLVHACASLGVHIMIGADVIVALTPQLLAAPDALRDWIPKLAGYAEAIVLAEQEKRQKGAA
ncbi:CerR family C-terminal domain-containing protein [Pseudoduganella chitinolytica]|uniref:CerR family C-terminal domain-containing protein n=1 Tax=Pseudoduganella chitinolytica TaxID=34070 RepID=A0ABY8BCU5_9BURK|nr:CerR family C-terminal domain-containing protein [Pseudoduganella chitinolytica]WEF33003.1 CerR family C-terminal domain-containing protein [Pseudoduganella chitinolytica]